MFAAQMKIIKTISTVKSHIMGKTDNIKKNFNILTIKHLKHQKNKIEDKESSNSYEIEAVEFLDHINFDNGDFDENAIDYIAECI